MRERRSVWRFACAALGSAAACRYPATAAVVAFDTNAPQDRPLTIRLAVARPGEPGAASVRTWVRGGDAGESIALPTSFGVVPGPSVARDGRAELVFDAELA